MYETELHNDIAAACFVPQRTAACLDVGQDDYEVNAGHLLVASLGNRNSPVPDLTGAQQASSLKYN
jgi:hypothetical protein